MNAQDRMYDVGGVMLPRPFKPRRLGHFALWQVPISRLGRDFPGSNWALYVLDPDGHRVEFYYGMEQIGWDRRSKPAAAYLRTVRDSFSLPQPAEMT